MNLADFDLGELNDSTLDEGIPSDVQKLDNAASNPSNWQLHHESIPRNPNIVSTTLSSKLSKMLLKDGMFRFAPERLDQVGQTPLPIPAADGSLHQSASSWGDLGLSRPVLKAICQVLRFASPTVIQTDVIPVAISGKDILATAATGSGKTAAFLLPLIERIMVSSSVSSRRKDSETGRITGGRPCTRAIVLLPTRELAVQCWSMLKALVTFVPVSSALVVGGFDSRDQKADLTKQPDIIIATPGRLLDHILNSQGVHLENVDMVVLDEADRLLELGFKDSITEILKGIPKKSLALQKGKKGMSRGQCQTLLFSATLSAGVKDLASMVLSDAVTARITDPSHVVSSLIQEFIRIGREEVREAAFFSLLESTVQGADVANTCSGRVIVFFKEKKESHRMATIGQVFGLEIAELNGNMSQAERLASMADFQSGVKRYLFATDLASRGLDLPNVELVVNYNLPSAVDAETRYIHRVGRTARMGKSGKSITLYTAEEYPIVKRIVKKSVDRDLRGKVYERKLTVNLSEVWGQRISSIRKILAEIEKEEKVEAEMYISSRKIAKLERLSSAGKRPTEKSPAKVWMKIPEDQQNKVGRPAIKKGISKPYDRPSMAAGRPVDTRGGKFNKNNREKRSGVDRKPVKAGNAKRKFENKTRKIGGESRKNFNVSKGRK